MNTVPPEERYNMLLQSRCQKLQETIGQQRIQVCPYSSSKTVCLPRSRTLTSGADVLGLQASAKDFEPLYELVNEMTEQGIQCSSRSFAALIDAASLSKDLGIIYRCIKLGRVNGVCRAFSRDLPGINPVPRDRRALEGAGEDPLCDELTAQETQNIRPVTVSVHRLLGRVLMSYYSQGVFSRCDHLVVSGLKPVPEDSRGVEVAAGVSAVAALTGGFGYEAVAPLFDADTTPASVFLAVLGLTAVYDLAQGWYGHARICMRLPCD
jgi:hypothetical protein